MVFKRKFRFTAQFFGENDEVLMPECFVKISHRPGMNLVGDSEGIRYYPTEMTVSQDAHIFLTEDQIDSEVVKMVQDAKTVLWAFGLTFDIELSTRPKVPMGDLELWDRAENALREAIKDEPHKICEGEGAFYGPKIDFFVTDSQGRRWQASTVQLDFQLPKNFELKYVAEDGSDKTPVVIHRAFFGSYERFIALLLEHYQGNLPLWLSPIQLLFVTVSDKFAEYAREQADRFSKEGFRCLFYTDGTVANRIMQGQTQRIPYTIVLGGKEQLDGTFNVRDRDGNQREWLQFDWLLDSLKQENVFSL